MVSKYLDAVIKIVDLGIPQPKGICVFGAVHIMRSHTGNTRDCFSITCAKCPFSKPNLNTLTGVIKHE